MMNEPQIITDRRSMSEESNLHSPIATAIRIANEVFSGRVDLDGKPAVMHALEVGRMGESEEEQIVGYLHDVVEDTEVSFEELAGMGFSPAIIDTLRLLTHESGSDYWKYMRSIIDSGNATAIRVKINDLRHNLMRGKLTLERAREAGDIALLERITAINNKHERALALFVGTLGGGLR